MQWTCRKPAGASVNLSEIRLSVHSGTHCDAPLHFDDCGVAVAALPLEPFLGPARLVDVSGRDIIQIRDLEHIDFSDAPRLLLRTDAWTDHERFPTKIPILATDTIIWLGSRGVRLLGVDVPSVDALDSKDLPNHHALGAANIAIIECLNLGAVAPAMYELIALPLRLEGADGAPVRAVLRSL
jgi:arylformamidase